MNIFIFALKTSIYVLFVYSDVWLAERRNGIHLKMRSVITHSETLMVNIFSDRTNNRLCTYKVIMDSQCKSTFETCTVACSVIEL